MTEFLLLVAIAVYVMVSAVTLHMIRKCEMLHPYDTTYCRDVRAQMDMICPMSRLERQRACVNSKRSKF
jgi:hypothetical protein